MAENDIAEISEVTAQTNIVYSKQQKIILAFIIIAQFFCGACLSLPAPFLPKLNDSHNIEASLTGVILSLVPVFMLILCPVIGKLIAGPLSARTVVIGGMALLGVCNIAFGLLQYFPAPTDDKLDIWYLVVALVTRAVQGVGSAAVLTSGTTILATAFKENSTTVISYGETAIGFGLMCGPAIGSGFYELEGFMLTFSGVGGIVCILFIIMCFIFPPVDADADEDDQAVTYKQIFTNVDLVASMVFTAVTGILWCSLEPILEPELRKKFGLSEELCALAFLMMSVPYTISTSVVGKAFEKWKLLNSLSVLLVGFVLTIPSFLFIGPTPLVPQLPRPLWVLLLCLAGLGIGFGFMIVPCLNLLLYDNNDSSFSSDATKAVLLGIWNSAFSLGDLTGPIISGTLQENLSFGWSTTFCAFVSSISALVIIGLKIHRQHTRHRQHILVINERTPLLSSDN